MFSATYVLETLRQANAGQLFRWSALVIVSLIFFAALLSGTVSGGDDHSKAMLMVGESRAGFWGNTTSNMDWCETNYTVSFLTQQSLFMSFSFL